MPMPTRYTRIMTWIFLILSLSFFWIRDFRWGLQIPLSEMTTRNQLDVDSRVMPRTVSQSDLVDLGAKAQAGNDATSMASVALHLKDPSEAARYAELAAKQDPSLSWIL